MIAAAILFAAGGTGAETETIVPPCQTEGAVTYISGGIGRAQQSAMERLGPEYTLELKFLPNGKTKAIEPAYVALTIKDGAGKVVFDRLSDGPLMLLALPDGRYKISAQNGTETQTRTVGIERGRRKVAVFDWSEQENPNQASTPLAHLHYGPILAATKPAVR